MPRMIAEESSESHGTVHLQRGLYICLPVSALFAEDSTRGVRGEPALAE